MRQKLLFYEHHLSFIKNGLQNIHGQFEVAPINKAYGHVAFICKCFHVEVLIKKVSRYLSAVSNYREMLIHITNS